MPPAWDRWVRALDHHGAERMPHRDIASLVATKYKAGSWWAQTVAVGYECIKGQRARGQKRNGAYEASKSRTFNVPVAALYEAWADASIRRGWLDGVDLNVRTATPLKSMRLGLQGGGVIAVGFTAKGKARSAVALSQAKLADADAAQRVKQYWSERFDAVGKVLAEPSACTRLCVRAGLYRGLTRPCPRGSDSRVSRRATRRTRSTRSR